MPEWVQVWSWMRYMRSPAEMQPLPHQGIDPEAMSMERYEQFRDEWESSGSPTLSVGKLVAVMSGAKADPYDDIPF